MGANLILEKEHTCACGWIQRHARSA